MKKEINCMYCNSKKIYLFAIINGKEIYDCEDCHKRTELILQTAR